MVGVRAHGRDPLVQAATLDEPIMDLTAVVHVHLPTNEETCFVGDGTEAAESFQSLWPPCFQMKGGSLLMPKL